MLLSMRMEILKFLLERVLVNKKEKELQKHIETALKNEDDLQHDENEDLQL